MNNQQLINQIEIEIAETQNNIQQWKETINNHESTLLTLLEELTQIKQNNMNKNNQNSPEGLNNNK